MLTTKLPTLYAVNHSDALSDEQYDFFYSIASPERRTRVGRFLLRPDKCRALVAEALLQLLLREKCGKNLGDVTIEHNEFGKPAVKNVPFNFNLSHSGSWVVGVAHDQDVGIDVEKIHQFDLGIVDRFFKEEEKTLISAAANDDDRREVFFRLWVLKESYIKAIGQGLSCPLSSFACVTEDAWNTVKLQRYDPALPFMHFRFVDLRDSVYFCAVCAATLPEKCTVTPLDPAELIEKLG